MGLKRISPDSMWQPNRPSNPILLTTSSLIMLPAVREHHCCATTMQSVCTGDHSIDSNHVYTTVGCIPNVSPMPGFIPRSCVPSLTHVIAYAVRARIDQAWISIAERTPHIRDVLVAEHGLEKTGEDVYERGRRGVIYFDCEPTSLAYVQRYFSTAGRWLSHQLGDHLQLGCAVDCHVPF